jgi:signal transduction histidine kinase
MHKKVSMVDRTSRCSSSVGHPKRPIGGSVMDTREIQRAWGKFIENGTASNAVRSVVAASWERSLAFQIPVERGETRLAPEPELVHRRSERSELLTAAEPALEQARVLLAEASSMIILTDPSGVIIETAGDPRIVDLARMIHLEQGGHWAEAEIGTNAIGTAIAALQPVQIHGVEHFCSEIQRWTCAATPIWHPTDGQLLGILDISGSAKAFNPQSLAFACAVGRQIESMLAQSIKDDHERLLRYVVSKRSHWLTEDIVAIDRRGMIVYATGPALQALERQDQGLICDGRISCLDEVPFAAWPDRLSQLLPNVSAELVVDRSRENGAILVSHRRKPVLMTTPEEMQVAFARASQSAVLEERNRLAGEIHDGLAQNFSAICMQLGVAKEELSLREGDPLCTIQQAVELASLGLAEARCCAHNLRLNVIGKSGLAIALQRLTERWSVAGRLRCNFRSDNIPENTLPPRAKHELLRITQEAIHNAVRHADPTLIVVTLRWDAPNLVLQVKDNGSGISAARLEKCEGFGLENMRERASEIDGKFEIKTAAGHGTTIIVTMPVLPKESLNTLNTANTYSLNG